MRYQPLGIRAARSVPADAAEPGAECFDRRIRRSLATGFLIIVLSGLGALLFGPFSDIAVMGFGVFIIWSVLKMA